MSYSLYKPQAMEARATYPHQWKSDLMHAPLEDCPFCCISVFCSPCVSYHLRSRVLYNDLSRYQCCGGFLPCSGHCGEAKCPQFCLCLEVSCCFPSSVAATRFLIQDQLRVVTTKCDNMIIAFMFFLEQLACIFSLLACILQSDAIGDIAQALHCLADLVYCSVCACMQTQHKIELDKRDGKFPDEPKPMAAPPPQQMQQM